MKKAIITFVIVFVLSLFTALISFAVCGGELIKTGIEYGIEEYREYRLEQEQSNDISSMIVLP